MFTYCSMYRKGEYSENPEIIKDFLESSHDWDVSEFEDPQTPKNVEHLFYGSDSPAKVPAPAPAPAPTPTPGGDIGAGRVNHGRGKVNMFDFFKKK